MAGVFWWNLVFVAGSINGRSVGGKSLSGGFGGWNVGKGIEFR